MTLERRLSPEEEELLAKQAELDAGDSKAAVALTDVFQDVNSPASALRVSAARTVLELAFKGVELEDLAVRDEELELLVARVLWLR